MVQALTADVAWPKETIILALSAVYPSNFWGGTLTINQYFDRPTFAPSVVHELIHLRTELLLGEDWFVKRHVTADKRAIFMELSAEVVLSRSTDELAQAARGTYPFFADYQRQLKQASGVPDFVEMCDILAQF